MIRFRAGKIHTENIQKFKNFDLLLTAYRYRRAAEEDYKRFRKNLSWSLAMISFFAFVIALSFGSLSLSIKSKNTNFQTHAEGVRFEKKQDANAQYSSFEVDASSASIITLLSGARVYIPAYAFRYHNQMLVEGKVEILFLEYEADKLSYEIYAFSEGNPIVIKEKILVERNE